MKTKTFLASLCLLCFLTGNFQANNPTTLSFTQESNDVPNGYEEIELRGSLALSAGSNAIVAGVSDNSIYIQFNQNLGVVYVTLYDPNGLTIYSGMVDTAVQQTLVIPVSFTIEGTYTVILENTFGYAEGDFEKHFSI